MSNVLINDGTAKGIGPLEISLDHKIVGQAWESNDDPGLKKVNTAVGLDFSHVRDELIEKMKEEIMTQKLEIKDLQNQECLIRELQQKINQQQKKIECLKRMEKRLSDLEMKIKSY